MIVLDTNVVSETIKPNPSQKVLTWFRSEPTTALFITAITEAELLYGIELLSRGRRRDQLEALVLPVVNEDFVGRILPFDSAAAREWPGIVARRRSLGKPISEPDARIAAIARSRDAMLATRNVRDFEDCGLPLIDPWA
jgi:toxin FitB